MPHLTGLPRRTSPDIMQEHCSPVRSRWPQQQIALAQPHYWLPFGMAAASWLSWVLSSVQASESAMQRESDRFEMKREETDTSAVKVVILTDRLRDRNLFLNMHQASRAFCTPQKRRQITFLTSANSFLETEWELCEDSWVENELL